MGNIGKNIRDLRKDRHMTQEELAERLFVTRQTVSNYETGRSNPDVEALQKLAEVLQTDLSSLIYGPPSRMEKKGDYKRLLLGGAVTAVLLIAYWILQPLVLAYAERYYRMGYVFLVRLYLKPLTFAALGWTVMAAVRAFTGFRLLAGKPWGRWLLAAVLIWYLLLTAAFFLLPLLPDASLALRKGMNLILFFLGYTGSSQYLFGKGVFALLYGVLLGLFGLSGKSK